MVQFTDNQKKALDLRRHMAITANAGAGKTAVLVERYVAILATTPAQVRDVVALTYTEKAASELRTKIAQSLASRMHAAVSANERAIFERIRDQLPSATIGTIHSFCAQLLREFPLEADIDAGFGIIEEVERTSLLEQVLDETVARIASGREGAEFRDQLFALVRIIGRKRMEHYLSTLLDKREQVDRLTGEGGIFREPIDDESVLRRWAEALAEAVVDGFGRVEWMPHLRQLLREGPAAMELRLLLDRLDGDMAGTERAVTLASVFEKVFTKEGVLRRRVFAAALDEDASDPHVEALGTLYRSARDLVEAIRMEGGTGASEPMLAASKLLLNVYKACYAEYAARKADLGKLDFDDLQLKVRDLLRQPSIRERVSGRYSHILVDEFQDTNTLQYEIILGLLRDLTTGNLFVVGDPKQSIYGFRNAEVEVFRSSGEQIARLAPDAPPYTWGGDDLASTETERRGNILLAESFRPLPMLAATINALFRKMFATERSAFDVPYTELASGRPGANAGAVELVLVSTPVGDDSAAGIVREESRSVARRIARLSEQRFQLAGKDGIPRPFRYSDCAVLLRRRANVRELELAFAEYNIPYHLSGGVGFYQTQEVYDLYNLFRFLLNRDDDVALAGVFRSPFIALSDAELFEISRERGGGTFWEKTLRHANAGRGTEQLGFGIRLLAGLQAQAARLPAPQLVQHVLTATGWIGTAASTATGHQRRANVRKLVRLLREFEEGGRVSLFDLVERLKGLVEEHAREGQAALDASGDAVRVMTIHAAKGLEFPVVVLPFLHERFRFDSTLLIDPQLGLGFSLENDAPTLKLLRYRNRRRTEAEERRIFYVACTRARDLLILSAHREARTGQESRYKWLLACLGKQADELHEGCLALEPETLPLIGASAGGFVRSTATVVPLVDILESDKIEAPPARLAADRHAKAEAPEIFTRPVASASSGEMFSATHLRTYLECPTKYYLKYVLGLPEQNSRSYEFDGEEDPDDSIVGELEGSLAHRVLQELGGKREQVDALVHSVLSSESRLSPQERDAAARSLIPLIEGCIESEFFREIVGSKERKTEYALSMVHQGGYLTGTIDCLYRRRDGAWAVVDYKSDAVPQADLAKRAAFYKPQIGFYAFLVSHYFKQESVVGSLLFLRHPEAPVHFRFGPAEIAEIGLVIGNAMTALRSGDFKRGSRLCSACTYRKGDDCLIPFDSQ